MKKAIAALSAALLLVAATVGGVWTYQNYRIVGHSVISKADLESINEYGQQMAMMGYMAGGQSCKNSL